MGINSRPTFSGWIYHRRIRKKSTEEFLRQSLLTRNAFSSFFLDCFTLLLPTIAIIEQIVPTARAQCLMGGWWGEYSFRCQPVDHGTTGRAMRVSVAEATPTQVQPTIPQVQIFPTNQIRNSNLPTAKLSGPNWLPTAPLIISGCYPPNFDSSLVVSFELPRASLSLSVPSPYRPAPLNVTVGRRTRTTHQHPRKL